MFYIKKSKRMGGIETHSYADVNLNWSYSGYGDFNTTSEYLYGNGRIISLTESLSEQSLFYGYRCDNLNKEFYSQDSLGSTSMITGRYGSVIESYKYDAFGQNYQGTFKHINEFGYNGKRMDSSVGLYNYGFRDYSPVAMRFTTVDPINDGTNWYAYVGNDPINFIDPYGLMGVQDFAETEVGEIVIDGITYKLGNGFIDYLESELDKHEQELEDSEDDAQETLSSLQKLTEKIDSLNTHLQGTTRENE